jgi:hypothetical protein
MTRPMSSLGHALLLGLLTAGACSDGGPPDDPLLPDPEVGQPEPAGPSCPVASGTMCTVAGTGIAGDGADGLPALGTRLYAPVDLAFGPGGAMVVVDWNNHRIRARQPDGTLRIVAGAGELSPDVDSDVVGDRLNHPTDVIFDAQGRLVIAAWHNSRVKRLDLGTGLLEDIAGTGARSYAGDDGPAERCELNLPVSVVFDPEGNLLISDQANQRIRRVDAAGMISTWAGSGQRGFGGDGGPAREALFSLPIGQRGHPAGHITLAPDGALYLADTENNRIRRVGPDGVVSTMAGSGTYGAEGEGGPATGAQLAYPVDVAIGPEGALYIADTENNCVRKVEDGVIRTVAGVCGKCSGQLDDPCRCPASDAACIGDGGPGARARLKHPTGITFDEHGNLYIADTLNHRIRVLYR